MGGTRKLWPFARIGLFFYGELMLGNFLLMLVVGMVPRAQLEGKAGAALLLGVFVTCLARMGLRMHQAHREGGWGLLPVLAFLAGLLGPVAGVVHLGRKMEFEMHAKARQSEAKIALTAVYGAEKIYFSEYKAYVHSFGKIGYTPEGQRRFYTVGFSPSCAAGGDARWETLNSPYAGAAAPEVEAYFRKLAEQPCRPAEQGFEVYAVGVIRQGGGLDVWKIDQDKKLTNVQIGL